jgi:branched-chain amino acid transport system substrate-binding protein
MSPAPLDRRAFSLSGMSPASMSRRSFLRLAGLAGAAGVVAGCDPRSAGPAAATARAIRIGYVSPQSGALAAFGEADNYVLERVRAKVAEGIVVGNRTHPVEIVTADTQSDPDRARQVATDLVTGRPLDLLLVASTPDTTNPVADVCEGAGVPCISTGAPWETWWNGRKGDPAKPFTWTWHFGWGLQDVAAVFTEMWNQVETNRVVGVLAPGDIEGGAWRDGTSGVLPAFGRAGFRVVDPGGYENQTDDFRPLIRKLLAADAQILTGVPQPPDIATFWKQASELGYRPRVATVSKAGLFPSFVDAMVPSAEGLSCEVSWSPAHPYKSSISDSLAASVAADYTERTGKQWTQPIGAVSALFEVALDVLDRTGNVDDRENVLEMVRQTNTDTSLGRVAWGENKTLNPVPNVARTYLVGGQWRRGTTFPFDLVVVSNAKLAEVPAAGRPMRAIPAR